MAFWRFVENRIDEAIRDGEFDDLPGRGRPLDLEEYFSWPEDLRMAYSILKSANCAPAEVEMLKEVAALEAAVVDAPDEDTRQTLQRKLAARKTELAIVLERRRRRPPNVPR